MKLLYQFATAKQKPDLGQPEVERRDAFLRDHVGAGVEIDAAVPEHGPASIESRAEAIYAAPATRRRVPVVNPVLASLAFAELCVRAGLSHSKKAYPTPPKLEML